MYKNTAGKLIVYAYDKTTNNAVIDDEGNITCQHSLDGADSGALTDTNPVPISDANHAGKYAFDLTVGETNGDVNEYSPVSSTTDVVVIVVGIYTIANNIGTPIDLDSSGDATLAGMLTKMADDNAGADFDAETDSLNKQAAAIISGFPVNNTADAEPGGGEVVTGTNTANDGDSTFLDDGTYWQVAATTAVGGFGLNVVQTFTLGTTKEANLLHVNAKETFAGAGDASRVHVWFYNYITTNWDQASDSGTAISGSSDMTYSYAILAAHQQTSDGEVQVRYTTTSTTTNQYLYLDQVILQTITSGPTLAEIAEAVWAHIIAGHDELTAGYALDKTRVLATTVAARTDASTFTIADGTAVEDDYVGAVILIEDDSTGYYVPRRVTAYAQATKSITVDRALGFTIAAGDHIYIQSAGYGDVNVRTITNNAVTAAAIADAAIDNATFAADVGSTAYASNIIALAVRKVLDELLLDRLVKVADNDDVVNDSIIAKLAAANSDWTTYDPTTSSLGANRTNTGTAGAGLTDVGGFSTGAKAELQVEANDALIANNLDHLMKTPVASGTDYTTEVPDGTVLSHIMTKAGDTSTYDDATDSLEGISDKAITAGVGSVTFTLTVEDVATDPIEGVAVWVTSDSGGSTVVAGTLYTNSSGQVVFYLDAATYYFWKQDPRYNFTNPEAIAVS